MSRRFIRVAVVWLLAGVLLGAWMGLSQQHLDKQVHVHGLLLGWVSCALFALVYRAWPAAQAAPAATAHFWLHNLGLLLLVSGLALQPREPGLAGPLLGLGTVGLVLASGLFGWCVWRASARLDEQPAAAGVQAGALRAGV